MLEVVFSGANDTIFITPTKLTTNKAVTWKRKLKNWKRNDKEYNNEGFFLAACLSA